MGLFFRVKDKAHIFVSQPTRYALTEAVLEQATHGYLQKQKEEVNQ